MSIGTSFAVSSELRQGITDGCVIDIETSKGKTLTAMVKTVARWSDVMSEVTVDIEQWAEENFGNCQLGDARRTRRAVTVTRQMVEFPDGSTPQQTEKWADLKAVYRLFDSKEATFTAFAEPHWKLTRSRARGTVLIIGDTMETDFGIHREIDGLGPTGNEFGLGFLLHNSMMVDADSSEILGMAGQELFYRQPVPNDKTSDQFKQRVRESEVWGRVIDQIGRPASGVKYVHVFDRGADNLEVFCHLIEQQSDWVIRSAQLHRTVFDEAGEKTDVRRLLAAQPCLGTYDLKVRVAKGRSSRTAHMEVRAAQATIRKPRRMTAWLKSIEFEEVTQWIVEAREVNAPKGAEALHWVLWTSLPVASFAAAWTIIEYYEKRWLIEEYHKAIKTGCRLESRQYQTASRLEAVAGVISVIAVRLLQLKMLARTQPNLPAKNVVPRQWLLMLRALRTGAQIETVEQFVRQLAGLGGFLMRKGDGQPGWMTIWRGTQKLTLAIRGHIAMKKRCG